MKVLRNIIMSAVILILTVSCLPQSDLSRDFGELKTWSDVFDIFWKRMSTNYLFWNLDYDNGLGWDAVYDDCKPEFDKLGDVIDSMRIAEKQKENTESAYRLFYEIAKNLSDGHFALKLTDTAGNDIVINLLKYRVMSRLGYSDDDILDYFTGDDDTKNSSRYSTFNESKEENTPHIAEYVFGIDRTKSGIYDTHGIHGFSSMEYYYDPGNNDFSILLGRNSDGIVYFSLSSFFFSSYISTKGPEADALRIARQFLELIADPETSGVIIDIRGNGGGAVYDLSVLWSGFMREGVDTIKIAETRRKAGAGRTDYGAWLDLSITKPEILENAYHPFSSDVPIAVLVNDNCLSCAELTCLTFMAYRDYHGYNVKFFGADTGGGFGALLYDSENDTPVSEDNYNGGISYAAPYMNILYTPYLQTRYLDGRTFEGKGIPVSNDGYIPYDYQAFRRGDDARLKAAIDWLMSTT